MKKKIIAVLVLALVVSTVSVFALGIGIQGGAGYNVPGNVAVTFKVDQSPLVFAGNFQFGDNAVIGLTGDYWISNAYLAGPFNYFIGVGFGATVELGDTVILSGSVRMPVGINAYFAKGVIEPYLQVVPLFGLKVLPEIGTNGFAVDSAVGIRFWF